MVVFPQGCFTFMLNEVQQNTGCVLLHYSEGERRPLTGTALQCDHVDVTVGIGLRSIASIE